MLPATKQNKNIVSDFLINEDHKSLKVVFIGPFAFYPKGTVIVRVLPLAKALEEHGCQVVVLLPPYDAPQDSGVHFVVNSVDFYNIPIPRSRLPLKYLYVATCLVKKALEFKPDVVHVFKPKGFSGLAGMLLVFLKLLRFAKVRLVVDSDDWEGYGGFADFYLKHKMYPKLVVDFFDFQERWLLGRADAVTVASRTLEFRALKLRDDSGLGNVFYIPNGPSDFPVTSGGKSYFEVRKSLGAQSSRVILLYTRFFEYAVEEIIELLEHVVAELSDAKLLVVGKGDFGEEEELLKLAEERGLLGHIVYVGWVRPEDVPSYVEAADMAIYPFRDDLLNRSKCPGKLVQLLSLGKAVVAYSVGQISEYIENGKSGMLVEPGATKEFARIVIELLKNRKLREELGEEAKRRIWKEFNWEKLARNLKYAYNLTGYL